jgi:VanZ family protein
VTASAHLLRWLPAIACMVLIFMLSDRPGLAISDDPSVDGPLRFLAHLGIYGVLGFLLVYALGGVAGADGRLRPAQRAVLAFALATLYGVSDEIHQSFVADRTGRLDDVLTDALGAALGVAAALAFERWVGLRSDRG